ncbi:hypothetical protein CFter6_2027 [Collimonas fungivorans]|uniref:Uncharacterized protein n=1 Tax=Collimonas fungivorans TaxID=158899 RepID=A0A127PA64_9BURK|nr:hypothetical protein [Collimonas fungivorans]AMO94719.1 hypothetical protein CFter6_2027 [Collimonas fungivorans]
MAQAATPIATKTTIKPEMIFLIRRGELEIGLRNDINETGSEDMR